ncbi:hypothetical protein [Agromyces ramosus]|uniref:Uncharacterized protein n=1 Tax=Agromyces ramosus TaxID=33879 RepID=A0ABU0R7D0_9MICO|nr:hypothetical protein [Agromyces ramosus]MDQ0893647.1 hypothetical protein [Agromyces ramosus]
MFISEITFPHLQAEREAQLTRELERRRVVNERLDSERAGEATTAHSSRSSKQARRAASAARQRGGDELTGSTWASTLKA